jgi:hypothetical protein
MASYIATFLESVRTLITAIEISAGVPAFNSVWIAPFLDIERLMDATRIPAAVILDTGGTVSAINGSDVQRNFTVAIVACVQRDHIGEASIKALLELGELLTTALIYDDTLNVFSGPDGDVEAVGLDTESLLLIVKSYQFTGEFERD